MFVLSLSIVYRKIKGPAEHRVLIFRSVQLLPLKHRLQIEFVIVGEIVLTLTALVMSLRQFLLFATLAGTLRFCVGVDCNGLLKNLSPFIEFFPDFNTIMVSNEKKIVNFYVILRTGNTNIKTLIRQTFILSPPLVHSGLI